jgi:predicted short-subunit dehydrogenase-like oxidoreductase (DUF2520 family)
MLDSVPLAWDRPLPSADLLVVAVRDDAVTEVAARLAAVAGAVDAAVHVSGVTPVSALAPLAASGPVGSLHPLQTLPSPEAGARKLAGAWVAVTSDDEPLAGRLSALAASLGARPFRLEDHHKPLYHAAAVAAANYPVAVLAMAERLFAAAGVDFAAAEPLVAAAVGNAFALGPTAALTGPVARGDAGAVAANVDAVRWAAPDLLEDFVALARATARVAGTTEAVDGALP